MNLWNLGILAHNATVGDLIPSSQTCSAELGCADSVREYCRSFPKSTHFSRNRKLRPTVNPTGDPDVAWMRVNPSGGSFCNRDVNEFCVS